jgi:arylamine N-acetyltransferase
VTGEAEGFPGAGRGGTGFREEARALLRALSVLPYENLSKIAAFHRGGRAETAQDIGASWLEDAARTGVGGTCFSLTWWLKRRLEALNPPDASGAGFSTAFLMADKRVQPNVHCGLLFTYRGRDYLLDPGYLIFEPLPLPSAGLSVEAFASPNAIRVEDVPASGVWRLYTGPRGALKHRFDFRKEPVDDAEFIRHWEASHHWEMMGYPVLNRVREGTQYYLQKNNLLVRGAETSEMRKLTDAEVRAVAHELFGLPRELVEEALGILGKPAA